MKTDWVRKLTSRKFWLAVATFVGMLVSAFGVSETEVAQITSLILAGATVIAYIIGEGLTDAASLKAPTDEPDIDEPESITEELKIISSDSLYIDLEN